MLGAYNWRPGRLARNTLVTTLGLGLRTLAQAMMFLIVARVLGVSSYGAFAAVLALAGWLSSFAGFGTQTLLMRDVARSEHSFPASWGRSVTALAISTPLLFGVYLIIAKLILPSAISFTVVILVAIADLVFAPMVTLPINAYQGYERMGRASRLMCAPIIIRALGALALLPLAAILPRESHLVAWAALYALASFVAAVYSFRLVRRDLGGAFSFQWRTFPASFRDGIPFSLGGAGLRLYSDIDKPMLARLTTLEITGAYSAAYRVVDIATLPLAALLTAALPNFFRTGSEGLMSSLGYARRIMPLSLVYSGLASILLYLAADLVLLLLGPGYTVAVTTLRWLAWLPIVSLPRLFLQTSLVCSGRERIAVTIITLGAAADIGFNFWLIPIISWRGAVVATYLAEALMAVSMFSLFCNIRRSKHSLQQFPEQTT